MDTPVNVVAILFMLSLVAAWILFKFLQSTATITKKEYQIGGAAAGFLIIYGALHYSYSSLAKSKMEANQQELAACQATLRNSQDDDHEVGVKGIVDPALKNTEIVFATKTLSLPDDGIFRFSARRKDVKSNDPPVLYIINEQGQKHLQLDPDEDLSNIKITLPKGAQP